jgi:hypothetical protein
MEDLKASEKEDLKVHVMEALGLEEDLKAPEMEHL